MAARSSYDKVYLCVHHMIYLSTAVFMVRLDRWGGGVDCWDVQKSRGSNKESTSPQFDERESKRSKLLMSTTLKWNKWLLDISMHTKRKTHEYGDEQNKKEQRRAAAAASL